MNFDPNLVFDLLSKLNKYFANYWYMNWGSLKHLYLNNIIRGVVY